MGKLTIKQEKFCNKYLECGISLCLQMFEHER